jgi:Fic family protein
MLEHIHAAIYGHDPAHVSYRKSESVPDFAASLAVSPADVPQRAAAINRQIAGVDRLKAGDPLEQAAFLAGLFAAIIAVHPFEDGNGRTARLAVQFCLRRWGRPLLSLPKVRNDAQWRLALAKAVAGDASVLTLFFVGALAAKPEMAEDSDA